MNIILIGVSGSGKSTVGKILSEKYKLKFFDGDDFHSSENIEKMKNLISLNDEDRQDWLQKLNQTMLENPSSVIACSALKPAYRDILLKGIKNPILIYLKAGYKIMLERHQQRQHDFFNGESMLQSQFDILVEPHATEALIVDVEQDLATTIEKIENFLNHFHL